MPSINLRLTDEQHGELERWAHDGHRSLQKEIIFRLFSASHADSWPTPREPVSVPDDPHFKPDPKK